MGAETVPRKVPRPICCWLSVMFADEPFRDERRVRERMQTLAKAGVAQVLCRRRGRTGACGSDQDWVLRGWREGGRQGPRPTFRVVFLTRGVSRARQRRTKGVA